MVRLWPIADQAGRRGRHGYDRRQRWRLQRFAAGRRLCQDDDATGSIPAAAKPAEPTETDLAFARNAASDVLTKGDKDASQPWENPETGARGSVTPLAQAYSSEGRTCVTSWRVTSKANRESWLQGAALPDRPRTVGDPHAQALAAKLKLKRSLRSESAFAWVCSRKQLKKSRNPVLFERVAEPESPLQKCHDIPK